MGRLSRLLAAAARRVAADPRVREKVSDVYEREVKPRAEKAWMENKPKLEAKAKELGEFAEKNATRENLDKAVRSIRDRLRQKSKRS